MTTKDMSTNPTKKSATRSSRSNFAVDDAVPGIAPLGGNSLAFPDDADPSAPITGSCGGNSL